MSETIIIGVCNDPPNKIQKLVGDIVRITTDIKVVSEDLIRPKFVVMSKGITDKHNYVYFGSRQYFAKLTMMSGGMWQIDCKSDALSSWRDELYKCRVLLDRSTNGGDQYLVDPLVQTRAFYNTYYTQSLGNTLDNDYLYLITI